MDVFNRRAVKYRLCDKPDFDPELSCAELREQENESQEYDGWWHAWTQVSENDAKSDNVLIVAYGVIETADGHLLELPVRWIRFIDHE